MSQPLDRTCKLSPLGQLDESAGEFWSHPFDMARQGDNLSAYERNKLFLNSGAGGFVDASFASGADLDSDSRSVMVADFDGDLAPDLLVGSVGGGPLRLFRNRMHQANRVAIRLRGVRSNRQGIGARVTVVTDNKRMIRDMFPANGFMGQSPPVLYVGLGTATTIKHLRVDWPSGEHQEYRDVPANASLTVIESDGSEGSGELIVQRANTGSSDRQP